MIDNVKNSNYIIKSKYDSSCTHVVGWQGYEIIQLFYWNCMCVNICLFMEYYRKNQVSIIYKSLKYSTSNWQYLILNEFMKFVQPNNLRYKY